MKKPLILVGGGGHCKSCIDVIEMEGRYVIEGILDHNEKVGERLLNYDIIGDDNAMDTYIEKGYSFLITVGQIKSSGLRERLYNRLKQKSADIATIISPKALVSKHATIERGTIVMHGAIVNAGASIGENVILNTNCLVEHEAKVGNHVHISTHAILNGACIVGDYCFVGSNSTIAQEVEIGQNVVIGAGAVVINNLPADSMYVGNPAKKIIK